jgi:hypothetical protein
LDTDENDVTKNHGTPLLANLSQTVIALLGLAVLYILSYAPVCRIVQGADIDLHTPDRMIVFAPPLDWDMYRSVEWVMDRTPLAEPLYWWAGVWDCGRSVRGYSRVRRNPPVFP